MNRHHQTAEFHLILDKLASHAHGEAALRQLAALSPILDEKLCERALLDTTGAKRLLETCGSPPIAVMEGIEEDIRTAEAGGMLQPNRLYAIARFCVACRRMSDYLKRGERSESRISFYGQAFHSLNELEKEIEACVDEEQVLDQASPLLRKLRREKEHLETRIRDRLQQLVQSRRKWLSDGFISQRNGHYVLPVLKQYQSQFAGTAIEASRSGGTVFMEPASVAGLQEEWNAADFEESLEIQRILYSLSDLAAAQSAGLMANAKLMDDLDVIFAKGSLSLEMNAAEVIPKPGAELALHSARHPLLDPQSCVPLELTLASPHKGVVITGPNTGGKTVALKTVALLSLMAQSGLHVPCAPSSSLPMFDAVFCDIGDSQSISQNLSTFSGHMKNVIDILENLSDDSLVLLDELGSGTDPAEGMGIAIAVLEALRSSGCRFLVTTHYGQVKHYVQQSEQIMSARMAFDSVTLRPLYRLEMGKAGESCALDIIRRFGMPAAVMECASVIVRSGGYTPDVPKVRISPRKSRLIRRDIRPAQVDSPFQTGDSVEVMPGSEKGIVYLPMDEQGNVIVQIKGEKRLVRHTRIRLLVPASELYPDDYDFSIVFDTVANRKASHLLSRRYDAEATVVLKEGKKD